MRCSRHRRGQLCPLNLFCRTPEMKTPFFAGAVFAIFFFSAFASVFFASSADFVGVVFAFGDGLGEAFATRVFLRVGFGVGLGVAFGFGVAVGFGVDVGSGVGVGSSISLFAAVTRGVSSVASSFSNGSDSGGGAGVIAGCGDSLLSGFPAARSSAPLIQTMLCAFEELLASTLQRINPSRMATCASAIRVTFRQKRISLGIYFASAFVAMPTFVICARRNVSIKVINFCTGNSRSGRITIARSGLACFN